MHSKANILGNPNDKNKRPDPNVPLKIKDKADKHNSVVNFKNLHNSLLHKKNKEVINMIGGISGGGYSAMAKIASMKTQRGNPFKKLDANTDGSLDIKELGAMAKKISKISGKPFNAEGLMNTLDTDKSGSVNQEEFKAGRPKGPPPGGMNGMATMGMKSMMGIKGGMKGNTMQIFLESLNESNDSIDVLDTNGDGIVDSQEAVMGMNNLVQQYTDGIADGSNQNTSTQSLLDLLG